MKRKNHKTLIICLFLIESCGTIGWMGEVHANARQDKQQKAAILYLYQSCYGSRNPRETPDMIAAKLRKVWGQGAPMVGAILNVARISDHNCLYKLGRTLAHTAPSLRHFRIILSPQLRNNNRASTLSGSALMAMIKHKTPPPGDFHDFLLGLMQHPYFKNTLGFRALILSAAITNKTLHTRQMLKALLPLQYKHPQFIDQLGVFIKRSGQYTPALLQHLKERLKRTAHHDYQTRAALAKLLIDAGVYDTWLVPYIDLRVRYRGCMTGEINRLGFVRKHYRRLMLMQRLAKANPKVVSILLKKLETNAQKDASSVLYVLWYANITNPILQKLQLRYFQSADLKSQRHALMGLARHHPALDIRIKVLAQAIRRGNIHHFTAAFKEIRRQKLRHDLLDRALHAALSRPELHDSLNADQLQKTIIAGLDLSVRKAPIQEAVHRLLQSKTKRISSAAMYALAHVGVKARPFLPTLLQKINVSKDVGRAVLYVLQATKIRDPWLTLKIVPLCKLGGYLRLRYARDILVHIKPDAATISQLKRGLNSRHECVRKVSLAGLAGALDQPEIQRIFEQTFANDPPLRATVFRGWMQHRFLWRKHLQRFRQAIQGGKRARFVIERKLHEYPELRKALSSSRSSDASVSISP